LVLNALDAAVLPALTAAIVAFMVFVWIAWFGRKGGRALDFRDRDDDEDAAGR
jgi:hypothetical protein